MSNTIEIEAKVLISREQYDAIVAYFSDKHFEHFLQTNYYIDSHDRILQSYGFTIRIRKKDNYTLTLKTPLSEGLLEKNQVISKDEYSQFAAKKLFPEGDIKRFLELLGIDVATLHIITSMTTDRIELDYEDGILCVDKNIYNGNTDYEIELEETSMENAQNAIKQLCEELNIENYTFNTVSKYARAMKTANAK